MPAEPDNSKIEELLKAYAKKRREEMGAPVELHPAARKMLQGEVARQRPAPPAERKGFFSLFLQLWPRFAVAGAAVVLLSLVLVNVNRHPNPNAAKEMAAASDQLVKKQANEPRANRAPAPAANGPVIESLFEDRDGISAEKNAKEVRLQRELKVAQNERAPMPTEGDARSGAPDKKPTEKSGEKLKRAETVADELAVANLSLDKKDAPKSELRVSLADGAAKADGDQDRYGRGPTGLGSAANPAPTFHLERPSLKAVPAQPLAEAEKAQTPAQKPADPTSLRGDFGVTDPLAGASGTRSRYYKVAPSSSAVTSNAVAFTQPSSTSSAASSTLLAYDTGKQIDLFKSSEGLVTPAAQPPIPPPLFAGIEPAQSSPAPVAATPTAAEATWNYSYFRNIQTDPVVGARFATINQQTKTLADDRAKIGRKETEQWGEGVQAQPLSATFNLQQNGNRIRIVDFDGSVYDGQLLQAAPAMDSEKQQPGERQAGAVTELEEVSKRGFTSANGQVAFRVSGTNRTVNKLVVVNGMILSDAAPTSGVLGKDVALGEVESKARRAKPAAEPSPVSAQKQQLPQILRASAIKGTVRLDITNQTQIEARRVSP